jgi:outer membrane protein assembly factor BamE
MSRRLLTLLLAALLAGCNLLYKPEVRQGNLPNAETLAALKAGMTRHQVRLLLGTPPVSDPFHPDRWDYVYTLGRAGDPVPVPARLTLFFKNDVLNTASGELAPAALATPNAEPAKPQN